MAADGSSTAATHRRLILPLNEHGTPVHGGLLIVERDVELVVRISPNRRMDLSSIKLWTDMPLLAGDEFSRATYRCAAGSDKNTDGVWEASIPANVAGTFELFVEYALLTRSGVPDGPELGETEDDGSPLPVRGPKTRFVVEPLLTVQGKPLPISGLTQQTVLTRCIGPMSQWDSSFAESFACSYNCIHFTPVQELGESGSAYSIYDQLRLSMDIFKGQPDVEAAVRSGCPVEEVERLKVALLRAKVKELEDRFGFLSMVDIVLNHTASNSWWLESQPDACYSLDNSPHLKAAFELDQVILDISMEIVQGMHSSVGASAHMRSSEIVNKAVDLVRDQGLVRARLWEFYTVHVDGALQDMVKFALTGRFVPDADTGLWEPDLSYGNKFFRRRRRKQHSGMAEVDSALRRFRSALAEQSGVPGDADGDEKDSAPLGSTVSLESYASADSSDSDVCELPLQLSGHAEAKLHQVADHLMATGAVWNDGTGDAFCVRIDPVATVRHLNELAIDGITIPSCASLPRSSPTRSKDIKAAMFEDMRWLVLYKRLVETVNLSLFTRYNQDMASAIDAIRGTAHHYWLSERRGAGSLSRVHPINHTYFTRVGSHALANNGFIWGGNPEIDFTLPCDIAHEWAVLSRKGQEPEYVCRTPVAFDAELMQTGLAEPGADPPVLTVGKSLRGVPRRSSADEDPSASSPPPRLVSGAGAGGGGASAGGSGVTRGNSSTVVGDGTPTSSPQQEQRLGRQAQEAPMSNEIQTPICTASTPYMRRDLVIWGDCVKLRYGLRESDSPWLWDRMKRYVRTMASVFHGFRIDNAHGTPIHVAAGMIDAGRAVRPELYVCGELFSGSDEKDVDYVLNLAFNGLIREGMQATSPQDFARNVHMHGGVPIASVTSSPPPSDTVLRPSKLPAIFFDCTHDNPTPTQKRHPADALSSAALVSASVAALGSTRGYDIMVPINPSVVSEARLYAAPTKTQPSEFGGICNARRVLNRLHMSLAQEGFNEVHVHHDGVEGGDIITVQRGHPNRSDSVVFVVRTAFSPDSGRAADGAPADALLHSVRIEGEVTGLELAAAVHVDENWKRALHHHHHHEESKDAPTLYRRDKAVINGLPCRLDFADSSSEEGSRFIGIGPDPLGLATFRRDGGFTHVDLRKARFIPGSVLVFRVKTPTYCLPATPHDRCDLAVPPLSALHDALLREDVTLASFNRLLYRCESEERDDSRGMRGVYGIPGYGPLAWAGFAGVELVFRHIRATNDMGHPLCQNIREGNWLADYLVGRLRDCREFDPLVIWLDRHFAELRKLSPGVRPRAFNQIVQAVYDCAVKACISRFSSCVTQHGSFVENLALSSVALFSNTKSAPLLHPALLQYPDHSGSLRPSGPSLAAGLPHFSTGFMRNWGRDTFISLRGMFLVTGRFEEARDTLLSYATVIRHGLVPNLMDGGRNPRFNARDATWWFLQALQDYCKMAPEGHRILATHVYRAFPSDCQADYEGIDRENMGGSHDVYVATIRKVLEARKKRTGEPVIDRMIVPTLAELVAEVLQKHASGIDFVEWNAGSSLDCHMKPEGFRVQVKLDPDTGLLMGGSRHNCGTWMDKMGESPAHGTDGVPATPRDGAPVEITGLLASTLRWLVSLNSTSSFQFPKSSVTLPNGDSLSLQTWLERLQSNFERLYWVPTDIAEDEKHAIVTSLVNRRGIYKDTYGGSAGWTDYQLRPNQAVAMAVAPELFDPCHAQIALATFEQALLGEPQLGVKTLDPYDWAYRGDYDNDSMADASVARGFNYHQGPEWVWPFGYYLRARLVFFPTTEADCVRKTLVEPSSAKLRMVLSQTGPHRRFMEESTTGGLPELTNRNGVHCPFSCTIQAWSTATLLDAVYDAQHLFDH